MLTGIACHSMLAQAVERKGTRIRRYSESQEESTKGEVQAVLRQIKTERTSGQCTHWGLVCSRCDPSGNGPVQREARRPDTFE